MVAIIIINLIFATFIAAHSNISYLTIDQANQLTENEIEEQLNTVPRTFYDVNTYIRLNERYDSILSLNKNITPLMKEFSSGPLPVTFPESTQRHWPTGIPSCGDICWASAATIAVECAINRAGRLFNSNVDLIDVSKKQLIDSINGGKCSGSILYSKNIVLYQHGFYDNYIYPLNCCNGGCSESCAGALSVINDTNYTRYLFIDKADSTCQVPYWSPVEKIKEYVYNYGAITLQLHLGGRVGGTIAGVTNFTLYPSGTTPPIVDGMTLVLIRVGVSPDSVKFEIDTDNNITPGYNKVDISPCASTDYAKIGDSIISAIKRTSMTFDSYTNVNGNIILSKYMTGAITANGSLANVSSAIRGRLTHATYSSQNMLIDTSAQFGLDMALICGVQIISTGEYAKIQTVVSPETLFLDRNLTINAGDMYMIISYPYYNEWRYTGCENEPIFLGPRYHVNASGNGHMINIVGWDDRDSCWYMVDNHNGGCFIGNNNTEKIKYGMLREDTTALLQLAIEYKHSPFIIPAHFRSIKQAVDLCNNPDSEMQYHRIILRGNRRWAAWANTDTSKYTLWDFVTVGAGDTLVLDTGVTINFSDYGILFPSTAIFTGPYAFHINYSSETLHGLYKIDEDIDAALSTVAEDADELVFMPKLDTSIYYEVNYNHNKNLHDILFKFRRNTRVRLNGHFIYIPNSRIVLEDDSIFKPSGMAFLLRKGQDTIIGVFSSFETAQSYQQTGQTIVSFPQRFEDNTAGMGIGDDKYHSFSAAFGNVINNYKADSIAFKYKKNLYVCNDASFINKDVLYENNGTSFVKKNINYQNGTWFDEQDIYTTTQSIFFDYNDDGWDDIFVTNYGSADLFAAPSVLYRNRGSSSGFDRIITPSFYTYNGSTYGASIGDIIGDSRLDIALINVYGGAGCDSEDGFPRCFAGDIRIFQNVSETDPTIPFVDVTDSIIDPASNIPGMSISIVRAISGANDLWINTNTALKKFRKGTNGKYYYPDTAVLFRDSFPNPGGTFLAYDFMDLDKDGYPELLYGDRLYRNMKNGTFTDVSTTCGLIDLPNIRGAKFFHFNGSIDREPDILQATGNGYSVVYLNTRSTTWPVTPIHFEVIDAFSTQNMMGTAIGDYDNDLRDDLFFCDMSSLRPNQLFHNTYTGTYHYFVNLLGTAHKYGNGYSNMKGIGGFIGLYDAGYAGDESHLVYSSYISSGQTDNISVDRTGLHYASHTEGVYDIVARFPSRRVQYRYSVRSGQYMIEEEPNMVVRSIGTAIGSLYNSGSGTTNGIKDQVTFTSSLPANIGEGDRLILDPSGTPDTGYIKVRVSDQAVALQSPLSISNTGTSFRIERAYNTITAWKSDRGGDLVTRGGIEKGVCYNDGVFTESVILNGSMTDANNYFWLTVASTARHQGTRTSNGVTINPSTASPAILIQTPYTIVEGFKVTGYGGSGYMPPGIGILSDHVTVRNNLIYQDVAGNGSAAITISCSQAKVYNNIIQSVSGHGIYDSNGWLSGIEIYNNTIYSVAEYGIYKTDGNSSGTKVKNNIVMNCGYGDFKPLSAFGETDYNLSSDSSAQGTHSFKLKIAADQFESIISDNEDLHLKGGADGLNSGINLSAVFNTDIDEETREYGNWDMGADESDHISYTPVFRSGENDYTIGKRPPVSVIDSSVSGSGPFVVTFSNSPDLAKIAVNDCFQDGGLVQHQWRVTTVDNITKTITVENSEYAVSESPRPVAANVNQAVIRRWFSTMQAWESARQGDLIADNRIEKGICYNDSVFKDVLVVDGSNTNASHYLLLTVAASERHHGTAGSGGVVINRQGAEGTVISLRDDFCQVEWLNITNWSTASYGGAKAISTVITTSRPSSLQGGYVVRNCIIHDAVIASGIGMHKAIYGISDGGGGLRVENCLVYNIVSNSEGSYGGAGITLSYGSLCLNSTIYGVQNRSEIGGPGVGIEGRQGHSMRVQNCIAMECQDNFSLVGDATWSLVSGYNLSSDADVPGSHSIINGNADNQFMSLTQPDFHLKSTADARNSGDSTGLIRYFTEDIDGQERIGIWDIGADGFSLVAKQGMGEEPETMFPKEFAMRQNTPNPFNPATIIKYEVPYLAGKKNQYPTSIAIYNIKGQLVRKLYNGFRGPGYYAAVWDGRDSQGKNLSSGLYICHLESGRFVKKIKMILAK